MQSLSRRVTHILSQTQGSSLRRNSPLILTYQEIINSYELDEFVYFKVIRPYIPRSRYKTFQLLKYPNHRFFKGPWGTEILLQDQNPLSRFNLSGYVYATPQRARAIKSWFEERKPDVIAGYD